jgi:hypothetical protein
VPDCCLSASLVLLPSPPKPAPCSPQTGFVPTHLTWAESGAIAPGEVSRLRNLSGYIPISWMEARSQLHSVAGLMGALMGTTHPTILAYSRFLRQYGRLFTRLESEIDQVYGCRLGPSLVTFHVQLAWRNWLVGQLDANETVRLEPPAFAQGLNMMEVQNNLMWLPTINNVPALSALRINVRSPATATIPRSPVPTQESGGRAPLAAESLLDAIPPAKCATPPTSRASSATPRWLAMYATRPSQRPSRMRALSLRKSPELGLQGSCVSCGMPKGNALRIVPEWPTMGFLVRQRKSGSRRGAR